MFESDALEPKVPTTVYGKQGCVQCKYTLKELDKLHVSYEYVDISVNPVAGEQVKDMGFTALPVVVTAEDKWSGFKIDRLRSINGQR